MSKKIFIVDDDRSIRVLLEKVLLHDGYQVFSYNTGEEALGDIESKKPDLFLLDLILPGISGLEVCERLKNNSKTKNIPVMMLTSRDYEYDVVAGFNIGCDDYITKPFSMKILLARIKAALRKQEREEVPENLCVKIKDLYLDYDRFQASIKSKILELTASEFKILYFLAKNKGIVFSRDKLFEHLKGGEDYQGNKSIDILINRVRKKLGHSYGQYIESVYSVGYKFKECE